MNPDVIRATQDPDVINALRAQLEEALVAANERGIELEGSHGPQTVQDVEAMETELKAALDELRAMKKKMS